jgi:hypothetical protein
MSRPFAEDSVLSHLRLVPSNFLCRSYCSILCVTVVLFFRAVAPLTAATVLTDDRRLYLEVGGHSDFGSDQSQVEYGLDQEFPDQNFADSLTSRFAQSATADVNGIHVTRVTGDQFFGQSSLSGGATVHDETANHASAFAFSQFQVGFRIDSPTIGYLQIESSQQGLGGVSVAFWNDILPLGDREPLFAWHDAELTQLDEYLSLPAGEYTLWLRAEVNAQTFTNDTVAGSVDYRMTFTVPEPATGSGTLITLCATMMSLGRRSPRLQ